MEQIQQYMSGFFARYRKLQFSSKQNPDLPVFPCICSGRDRLDFYAEIQVIFYTMLAILYFFSAVAT